MILMDALFKMKFIVGEMYDVPGKGCATPYKRLHLFVKSVL